MKTVTLQLDDALYPFYAKLAQQVGRTPEQVMADALFRLAGEASLQALQNKNKRRDA